MMFCVFLILHFFFQISSNLSRSLHTHLAVWGATQEDIVVFLKQHGIHARVGTTTPEHLGQRVEIFGKHGDFCEVNDKYLTWFQCHMEYNETISSLKGLVIFDTPKIMVLLKDLQGLVNIEKPKGAIGKKTKQRPPN